MRSIIPILILSCLLMISSLWAQSETLNLRGQVVDVDNQPLVGVAVKLMNAKRGVVTDLDGRFVLRNISTGDTLAISLLGYMPQAYPMSGIRTTEMLFVMTEKPVETDAVVITPGENPAHRMIRAAIANRKRNSPDNLAAYAYTSYNKLKFYPEFDTTLQSNAHAFFDTTMFGFWESVTQKLFMKPAKEKEIVLASRLSGLKDRAIPFSPTSFQDLSFYNNWVTLLGIDYVSPIADNALDKYNYTLYDTLYDGVDTVYSIAFEPKNVRIMGLKGDLKLHSRLWSIHTVTGTLRMPADMQFFDETLIQQVHAEVADSVWFPVQLYTKIAFNQDQAAISVTDSTDDSLEDVGQLFVEVRSDFRDVNVDTTFSRRSFDNIALDVMPEAAEREDAFFDQYRTDSLTAKERNTYTNIDSLADETNLLAMAEFVRRLSEGFVRLGPIDIDLYRLYMWNDRERHRFGLGGFTNSDLSRKFTLGGYFGWATGDRAWKYGGSAQLHPFKNNFIRLHLGYQYDLVESGGSMLYTEANKPMHKKFDQQMPPRRFNVGILEYEERIRAELFFPSLRNVHHRIRLQHSDINPWYDYSFQGLSRYQLSDLVVDTRIGFGEKYIRTDRGLFSMGTKWPVVTLRYTHGFDNLLGSDFSYNKMEAVLHQSIPVKGFGRFSYQLSGGEFIGDLPLSRLHPFQANGQASIFSDYFVMNAMPYNSFYASRYGTANLHFNIENTGWPHPKWTPDPMLAYGFAIGQLSSYATPEHQSEWQLQAPNQGYHEVGVEIGNLFPIMDNGLLNSFNLFSIGAYYRLGSHAEGNFDDDFAFKIGFNFLLD